jgi:hypothetical protein
MNKLMKIMSNMNNMKSRSKITKINIINLIFCLSFICNHLKKVGTGRELSLLIKIKNILNKI